jgi:hypothetical protein
MSGRGRGRGKTPQDREKQPKSHDQQKPQGSSQQKPSTPSREADTQQRAGASGISKPRKWLISFVFFSSN